MPTWLAARPPHPSLPRSFAGLLDELAGFDWKAAAAAAAEGKAGGDDAGSLDMAQHVSRLLLWVMGHSAGKAAAGTDTDDQGTAASAALHAAAGEVRHAAAEQHGAALLQRMGSGGFERPYNAHVPGRVVLVFDGANGGGGGLALVSCAARAVRRLRLSRGVIVDHFIDRPEVVDALGG